jgi:outer membrane protein assembly factor BamB
LARYLHEVLSMDAKPFCRCAVWGAVSLLAATAFAAEPSIGWRYDGSGRYPAAKPPNAWSADKSHEQNVRWKSPPLGRSIASPVVVAERVFTTADPAELICLGSNDGQVLWQRPHTYAEALGAEQAAKIAAEHEQAAKLRKEADGFQRELDDRRKAGEKAGDALRELETKIAALQKQIEKLHAYPPIPGGDTGNTASTPVTDGQHVYAVFGTGIVSAHTLDGERRWMKFVAAPANNHSASPLLVDGLLIVSLRELQALDPATGNVAWRAAVDERNGTPIAVQLAGGSVIVTPGGAIVRAADGHVLAKDQFRLAYCSPIVSGGVIYAVQEGTIKALKLPETADEPFTLQTLWEIKGARTHRLASPVVHDGLLYTVTEKGVLEVYDAASGDVVYQKRLSLRGRADPSLCLAGDLLFASGNDGTTLVLKPGREFAELAKCRLEEFTGTPTFHGPRVFIRTKERMICLGEE